MMPVTASRGQRPQTFTIGDIPPGKAALLDAVDLDQGDHIRID
jgi:hypothetical protein